MYTLYIILFIYYYIYRCGKWVCNVRSADLDGKGPADLKHLKLCGLHFEDSQ